MAAMPLAGALRATHLFDALGPEEFEGVVAGAEIAEVAPGVDIVREDDAADALFVILDGAVQVYTRNRQLDEIVLARLEAGRFFGEQALLPGASGRRNASVRAFETATIARIGHDAFQRALALDYPSGNASRRSAPRPRARTCSASRPCSGRCRLTATTGPRSWTTRTAPSSSPRVTRVRTST